MVIVPPNYGHVTINPSESELITANWVCRDFQSIYDPYTERRGACYYYVNGEWIANTNYTDIPALRFLRPVDVLNVGRDMYRLVKNIEKLEFLTAPQKHQEVFKKCFLEEKI